MLPSLHLILIHTQTIEVKNFSTAHIWISKMNQICTLMTGTLTNLSIFLKYGIGFHSSGTRSFTTSTAHSTHGLLATCNLSSHVISANIQCSTCMKSMITLSFVKQSGYNRSNLSLPSSSSTTVRFQVWTSFLALLRHRCSLPQCCHQLADNFTVPSPLSSIFCRWAFNCTSPPKAKKCSTTGLHNSLVVFHPRRPSWNHEFPESTQFFSASPTS